MSEEVNGPKIGEGHAAGMFRQGLKELAQALPAFPDSVRPVEEAGVFGNPTPQIVTQEMGVSNYQDMLNGYIAQNPPQQQNDQGLDR